LLRESSITDEDMKTLQTSVDANAKVLADMGTDAAEAAARRLKQWMTISELKNTVRVICRVRSNAANLQSGSVVCGPSSTGVDDTITVLPPPASVEPTEGQAFVFDKVIPAQALTEETFKHLRDLVDHAVAGEQVCIFSCGQSGSGKSSVLGDVNDSSENVRAIA
jgi:kinesin family protein C1